MLTLFTLPRAFNGSIGLLQRNAIQSWLRLQPVCEVLLCGNDPGIAEAAAEFGTRHLPEIPCNQFGTPLLDQTFVLAQQQARHDLVCYINADIILMSDFMLALQRVRFKRYLVVGRRCNLDLAEPLDFSLPDWEMRLAQRAHRDGELVAPHGSDYFVFRKDTIGPLPPFAVGRPGWDNWMIYHARARGYAVVDATPAILAVHQNHDYSHIPQRVGKYAYGPEADRNLELMGGQRTRFNLYDATHLLTPNRVLPAWGPRYLARRVVTLAALHPRLRPLVEQVKRFLPKRQ